MQQPPEHSKELQELVTPQESVFLGMDASFVPGFEKDFYKVGKVWLREHEERVLKSTQDDPAFVDDSRQNLGYVKSRLIAGILGFKDQDAAVALSKLDEFGYTVDDPKVLGIIDEKTGGIQMALDRDLTLEAYQRFHERGIDLHLRTESARIERERNRGEKIA